MYTLQDGRSRSGRRGLQKTGQMAWKSILNFLRLPSVPFHSPRGITTEMKLISSELKILAQTSLNHWCSIASRAVSLFGGSKFVKPLTRCLKSASLSFQREIGLRGLSLLKPSRMTLKIWTHGLSPRYFRKAASPSLSAK